jgi:hypothetical protein
MKIKAQEKENACILRSKGISINEIAKQLSVSKSSVSSWVRDISITEAQRALLKSNSSDASKSIRNLSWQTTCRNRRLEYQRAGIRLAEQLSDCPQFTGGCMLYWAEGAKDKNSAKLANTDKYLMKCWWDFLQQYFGLCHKDVTIHISCYLGNGHTVSDVESYWLTILALPKSCLRKTMVVTKHPMSTGRRKNKHPYGVCSLNVNSTKLVQKLFGAIQYIGKISEPRWLG